MPATPRRLVYRALVLLLLFAIAAAICYNYYQGSMERRAERQQLDRIEKQLRQ